MNHNPYLPVWVNAILEILNIGIAFGRWCRDRRYRLTENHCSCEICEEKGRGKFKTK